MQRARVLLLGTLALTVAGCGAVQPVAGSGVPTPGNPTNQTVEQTLRSSCWFLNDLEIASNIGLVDDGWWAGISYGEQIALNGSACGGNAPCEQCWDDVVDYVYRVWH